MSAKEVVGLFSNIGDAQAAEQEIRDAGFSSSNIRLSTSSNAGSGTTSGSLISTLTASGVPDDDANVYAEGVRRGGALLTVQTDDDALASQAADIMDRHNVQDIDELGKSYRSSGWTRYDENAARDTDTTTGDRQGSGLGTGIGTLSGAATGAAVGSVGGPVGTVIGGVAGALTGAGVGKAADKVGAEVAHDHGDYSSATPGTTHDTSRIGSVTDTSSSSETPALRDDTRTTETSYSDAPVRNDTTRTTETTSTTGSGTGYVGVAKESGEFAVPVVEEQINVGKQQYEGGGVRVDTHVTETPVNEEVTLHHEKVNVERRPVDQPIDAARIDELREGTFEVREMEERPVVNKEARVVEEVVINKQAGEHTHTVQDTVRRTDVNVEQLATEMRPTGYTESTTSSTTGTQGSSYGTTSHTTDVADRGINRTENAVDNTAHKSENVIERAAGAVERGAEDVTGSDLNSSGGVGDKTV